MHFGIFMEFEARPGRSQTDSFRVGFDLVEAADAWGLDGVWLGEMHFNPACSVLGAPIVVAELDSGGQIPPERVKRSLHILTHEVMPAFK